MTMSILNKNTINYLYARIKEEGNLATCNKAEIGALVDNVVDPGVFNKTIIVLGLAGYKMIITNEARIVGYLSLHIQRALVE